jgi:hypothetical protein
MAVTIGGIDPVTAGMNFASTLIDKLFPDKAAADKAKADLVNLQVSGDLQLALGQLSVDLAEAQNSSVFVAGWRPFIGWACGSSFAYAFILQPIIQVMLVVFHSSFDPAKLPQMNFAEMMPVLLGMLGLGAMRSYDKKNGTGNGQ